ncbi:MAG: AI-2E family transporter [Bacilli bacterium]|nr:AI-2E family transporter [Bacilli bacterium]
MKKEKRTALLQIFGIIALVLISLKYLNELFGPQISTLIVAINTILLPLGIALFISYLLAPIVNFIEKRFKIKNRILNIAIVFVLISFLFGLFSYYVGNIIYQQAVIFIESDWDRIVIYVNDQIDNNESLRSAYDNISAFVNFGTVTPILFNFVNIIRGVTGFIITIVLVPVFLFFILHDKKRIFQGIISVVPKNKQKHLNELGSRANTVIEKYFNGRFISMFVMSIFFTIFFLILGFKEKSIFFGFTLGFLDIIPYVGGFIGMLLPILFSFTISDQLMFGEWAFVAVIIGNFTGQFIQGNILQPFIMGKEVNLHPLLVLSSFIFFGALFGVTGIILAIPITGIIKTSFEYFGELKKS